MQFDWQKLFDEVKSRGEFGSDAQLAAYLGITRAQISAWRNGKSELGTFTKLKLLDALGYDSLRTVMSSLWPTSGRQEFVEQHNRLVERVNRVRARAVREAAYRSPAGVLLDDNRLLAVLPEHELKRLSPYLSDANFDCGQVLSVSAQGEREVYFPTSALLVVSHTVTGAKSAEAALTGFDGLVGIGLSVAGEPLPTRTIVQNGGHTLRLSSEILVQQVQQTGALRGLLFRYMQTVVAQMAQTVSCNRYHAVSARLCRWLLLSLDRVNGNRLEIDLQFLSSVLATSEADILEGLSALDAARVIRLHRDSLEVVVRQRLEARACGCYGATLQEEVRQERDQEFLHGTTVSLRVG